MAIIAVITSFGMRFVTEFNVAGICRKFVPHGFQWCGVTFLTVTLNAESALIIVAISAGFALLHLQHAEAFITGARNINIRVAILAAVGGNMHLMTEYRAAGAEVDLFDCMTLLAIGFNPKRALVIMTRSAAPPFFHISHCCRAVFFVAKIKYCIVAIGTTEKRSMNRMAESRITGLFDLEYDIDC